MDPAGQLRNLRDFLLVYNRMTEICFQRCTSNFNYRNLTMDEERCADNCAGKLIRTNHRLMGTYVQLMPAMVQKRMQEMESKAAEVAKAESAAQGGVSASENPSAVMTDTQPLIPSNPGMPAASSPVEIPSRASASSEIKASPLVFEPATQAPETAKLPTVTNNAQTATIDSLQGQINVTPVISTSTNSSVGSISSAVADIPVDKLNLKPSNVTATSVSEKRSTGGADQNSQTSS